MKDKEIMECAGNLELEMEEMNRLYAEQLGYVVYGSFTRACEQILTFFCR